MPLRLVAVLAAPLLLAGPALAQDLTDREPAAKESAAKEPAAKGSAAKAPAREPSAAQSAARARQKTCGAEWRALTAAEKASRGPRWPQYFSACVKRLKEVKA